MRMNPVALGKNIRAARKMRKLTLESLAEKVGVGRIHLGEIERGKKLPSMKVFIQLVETLGVSADYLLQNEITAGKHYILDSLSERIGELSPAERKTAAAIVNAFIDSIEHIERAQM